MFESFMVMEGLIHNSIVHVFVNILSEKKIVFLFIILSLLIHFMKIAQYLIILFLMGSVPLVKRGVLKVMPLIFKS